MGRRLALDRGTGRREPAAKSRFCRTGHADRGGQSGAFHDHRGGRAIAAVATLPTGPAGRSLALAILCLALGGVYLLLVSPVLDLYSQREATLADRRMLAPRLSAAAAELP